MQAELSVEVAGYKNFFFFFLVWVEEALSIEVAGCKKKFLPGGRGAGGIFS